MPCTCEGLWLGRGREPSPQITSWASAGKPLQSWGWRSPAGLQGRSPSLPLLEQDLPGPAGPSVSPGSTGKSCEPENCPGPSLTRGAQWYCSDSHRLPGCSGGELRPSNPHHGGTELTRDSGCPGLSSGKGGCPQAEGPCPPTLLAKCYHLRIFLQRQMFVEHLLCAWHCSRCWGYSRDQDKSKSLSSHNLRPLRGGRAKTDNTQQNKEDFK